MSLDMNIEDLPYSQKTHRLEMHAREVFTWINRKQGGFLHTESEMVVREPYLADGGVSHVCRQRQCECVGGGRWPIASRQKWGVAGPNGKWKSHRKQFREFQLLLGAC